MHRFRQRPDWSAALVIGHEPAEAAAEAGPKQQSLVIGESVVSRQSLGCIACTQASRAKTPLNAQHGVAGFCGNKCTWWWLVGKSGGWLKGRGVNASELSGDSDGSDKFLAATLGNARGAASWRSEEKKYCWWRSANFCYSGER